MTTSLPFTATFSVHYHSAIKRNEKRFINHWAKRTVVRSLRRRVRKYRAMVAGRHPIDRLFSAYSDKIAKKKYHCHSVYSCVNLAATFVAESS